MAPVTVTPLVSATVAGGRAQEAPLRLTRRGRLLLRGVPALFLAFLALAALVALLVGLGAPSAHAARPDSHRVAVFAGDTLWGVAERLDLDRDIRDVVEDIRRMNMLHGSEIHAGQNLWLPVR